MPVNNSSASAFASSRIILLTLLIAAPLVQARAQESLPDNNQATAEPQPESQPQEGERIVEGRPGLYNLKRDLHPLTWLEEGPKPLFRSAKEGRINMLMTRKPNPHYQFGVGGAGN